MPQKEIFIQGSGIPVKRIWKYLEGHLNCRLSSTNHVTVRERVNAANIAAAALYPLLNRKSRQTIHTKLRISKMYNRPVIAYAGPV